MGSPISELLEEKCSDKKKRSVTTSVLLYVIFSIRQWYEEVLKNMKNLLKPIPKMSTLQKPEILPFQPNSVFKEPCECGQI